MRFVAGSKGKGREGWGDEVGGEREWEASTHLRLHEAVHAVEVLELRRVELRVQLDHVLVRVQRLGHAVSEGLGLRLHDVHRVV